MVFQPIYACSFPGSSPRLWGTSPRKFRTRASSRFIPTPVGNMISYPDRKISLTVHPHACGEHIKSRFFSVFFSGSSPRLWGTCLEANLLKTSARFIPTPVGNITTSHPSAVSATVHPHACGEHVRNGQLGLIHLTVHPHACGEHNRPGHPQHPAIGSSPRLWGT